MNNIYEKALLSLLKIGDGIVIEDNDKKYILVNDGLTIDKTEVMSATEEELKLLKSGTIVSFNIGVKDVIRTSSNILAC